jgi:hypothetical protein
MREGGRGQRSAPSSHNFAIVCRVSLGECYLTVLNVAFTVYFSIPAMVTDWDTVESMAVASHEATTAGLRMLTIHVDFSIATKHSYSGVCYAARSVLRLALSVVLSCFVLIPGYIHVFQSFQSYSFTRVWQAMVLALLHSQTKCWQAVIKTVLGSPLLTDVMMRVTSY